jgi:hypothetical protein
MNNVCMIGLQSAELEWVKRLVTLLRHPDPVVPAVAKEALAYLESLAARSDESSATG